jgi:hypothetical protein
LRQGTSSGVQNGYVCYTAGGRTKWGTTPKKFTDLKGHGLRFMVRNQLFAHASVQTPLLSMLVLFPTGRASHACCCGFDALKVLQWTLKDGSFPPPRASQNSPRSRLYFVLLDLHEAEGGELWRCLIPALGISLFVNKAFAPPPPAPGRSKYIRKLLPPFPYVF